MIQSETRREQKQQSGERFESATTVTIWLRARAHTFLGHCRLTHGKPWTLSHARVGARGFRRPFPFDSSPLRARAAERNRVPHSGFQQAGTPAEKPLHRARICFSLTEITSRKRETKTNEFGWMRAWVPPPARLDSWIHPENSVTA